MSSSSAARRRFPPAALSASTINVRSRCARLTPPREKSTRPPPLPRGLGRLADHRAPRVRWAAPPPREAPAPPAAVHLRAARTRRRALEPQVVPPDLPALVQEHGPLDDVGELPHGAGPGGGGVPGLGG